MPEINRNALNAFRTARLDEGALKGKALDDAAKTAPVDNDVSVISFFQRDGMGNVVPYLNADPAPVADPGKLDKVIAADGPRLAALKGKPEAFKALVTETVAARQAYLRPTREQVEGAPTSYKFNAIVGGRIDQFRGEAVALAQELYGRDAAQLDAALYAVNTACFDLYSREVRFDNFEINGYASFGHDAAFIHAWERRLDELNKVDERLLSPDDKAALGREKAQIQGELDAIFRSKYVYNSASMYEVNAEVSVGLCLIDKGSRGRVSEKLDSLKTIVPEYETITVDVAGAPRPVFYDHETKTYFFDRSAEAVPAELAAKIDATRTGAARHADVHVAAVKPADCTFRRAVSGEQLRKNFRFDWDGDGYVNKAKIDWTSWGGHCDVKAMLESHGLVVPEGHAGVYEYDALSGSTAHYDRNLLNEISMSLGELGSGMIDARTRQRTSAANEAYQFAGARDDDRPDRLALSNGRTIPFRDRPNEFNITKIVTADKEYAASEVFREHIVADDERSASPNPLFDKMVEGDRVQLKLGAAAVHAAVKYQVFDDDSGYPTMKSADVVIDFAHPSAEPIVVDSVMADPGQRIMWEISIDTKNKQWIAQKVQMVDKADGARGYDKKLIDAPMKERIDPNALFGQRETSLDDPAVYMPLVKEALQTAKNFTSETADGAGVWNGRTRSLKQATVWRDDATKWAKVTLDVDARYGGNQGAYLVKLKNDGTPDYFVPLRMPFDFAWRTDAAMAPVLGTRINETALERGVVSDVGGRFTAEAVSNLLEILQCGFSDRRWVIKHNGQRYHFDNKQDWEAAKAHVDQLRGAVFGAEPEPGPGPVVSGVLLAAAGQSVASKALAAYQVVAQADGDITIKLDTAQGDADLYVSKGAPATAEAHQLKSWNSGTDRDEIVLKGVKKGEVINIGVHGYKASDYSLEVVGPKVGAEPAPPAPTVDVALSGVLARGELSSPAAYPIEIAADGVLAFTMSGSGDADIWVGVNREPSRSETDFKLEGATSNEQGTLKVKKGDKVYVKVYGWGASSEFDLRVKSE